MEVNVLTTKICYTKITNFTTFWQSLKIQYHKNFLAYSKFMAFFYDLVVDKCKLVFEVLF